MTETTDLIVIGSGAAGLSAAVTAAFHRLTVVVLEKAGVLGGTTAWSGGWIWAPCNPVVQRGGIVEDSASPRQYLQAVLGDSFDADRVGAFLTAAPEMVGFFEENTELKFEGGLGIPDTYGDLPGAGTGGRSIIAQPFDGRNLGKSIKLLRKPLRETSFFGMTIQAGPDLRAFMTLTRSMSAFAYATKRILRHVRDLSFHRRGMDLRNGNALIARLFRSALDLSVDLRTGTVVSELLLDDGRVNGVRLAGGEVLFARKGIVLAAGGYSHDKVRRAKTFPRNKEHIPLAVPTTTGDGARLAEAAGAVIQDTKHPAAYCPVSNVRWPDGRIAQFPHIIERGKPGVIGVLSTGRRFCNEGLGYHDYVTAMLDAIPEAEPARSWLVCDHRFLRRYGLGVVRPTPVPWRQWLHRGYLKSGKTITELAQACGIDPNGLNETVDDCNSHAKQGVDPAFGRGTTPYMRLQGDPEQQPNPCIAPILKPPFFAVEVVPGSFGTFAGIATDGQARVLDATGQTINGLYAAGTDAASVFGGFYPAGGINLGPALTFGYVAGRHVAGTD